MPSTESPDVLLKAKYKRRWKDSKGNWRYEYDEPKAPGKKGVERPKELLGYSRSEAEGKLATRMRPTGNLGGRQGSYDLMLTGGLAQAMGKPRYTTLQFSQMSDAQLGKLLEVLHIPPKHLAPKKETKKAAEKAEAAGLSPKGILEYLKDKGAGAEITSTGLGVAFGLDHRTISAMLAGMEKEGKLQRVQRYGQYQYSLPPAVDLVLEHRGQAGYEERTGERQEKKVKRAERLEAEAASRAKAAKQTMEAIPMGQPILVGHHSEKRHRRDLKRMQDNMQRAMDAEKQAAKLRASAANPSSAISADDPEAVVKLKEKLGQLEAQREKYKAINAAMRKKGATPESVAEMAGISLAAAKQAFEPDFAGRKGIPQYQLTNLGANIRRIKDRIKGMALEAAKPEAKPVQGAGWKVHEDHGDNRIWVTFDQKPPREVTKRMRSEGFKWSPNRGAWIRQLNNNGRYAAGQVAKYLATQSLPGAVSPTTGEPTKEERQKLEQPHIDRANKAQDELARAGSRARLAVGEATLPDVSTDKRTKAWSQAAVHFEAMAQAMEVKDAAWDQVFALRNARRDKTMTQTAVPNARSMAEYARQKATQPDAALPLPDSFGMYGNETMRALMKDEERTVKLEKKRASAEAKVAKDQMKAAAVKSLHDKLTAYNRSIGNVTWSADTAANIGDVTRLQAQRGLDALVDQGKMVKIRKDVYAQAPEAERPKPLPSKEPKMKKREKAGQMLLLSRTAKAHEDRLEKAQPSASADITPEKARQILHDGTVHGKPITEQQRKFFGAIGGHLPAPGSKKGMKKADDGKPGESLEETSTDELTQTHTDLLNRLKAKPDDPAMVAREKAIAAELKRRGVEKSCGKKHMAKSMDDWLEKAKYIRREGGPGNYRYYYRDASGKEQMVPSRGAAAKEKKPESAKPSMKETMAGVAAKLPPRKTRLQEKKEAQAKEAEPKFKEGERVEYQGAKGTVKRTQGDTTVVQFDGSGTTGEGILTERLKPAAEEAKGDKGSKSAKLIGALDMEARPYTNNAKLRTELEFYSGKDPKKATALLDQAILDSLDFYSDVGTSAEKAKLLETARSTRMEDIMEGQHTEGDPKQLSQIMMAMADSRRAGMSPESFARDMMTPGERKAALKEAQNLKGDPGSKQQVLNGLVRVMQSKGESTKGEPEGEAPKAAETKPKGTEAAAKPKAAKKAKPRKVAARQMDALRAASRIGSIVAGGSHASFATHRALEQNGLIKQSEKNPQVSVLTDAGREALKTGKFTPPEKVKKSMTTNLDDWMEKAGMPTHEVRMGGPKSQELGGSQDGGDLDGLGKTPDNNGGTVDAAGSDKMGQPTGVPGAKSEKLSEDDEDQGEIGKPNRKKPIETVTKSEVPLYPEPLTPARQRDMVAREIAVEASRLRKGEEPITIGPGAHPLSVAQSMDAADIEALSKAEGSTDIPSMRTSPGQSVAQSYVLCKSVHPGGCDSTHSAMLTACPECGAGTVHNRVLPRVGSVSVVPVAGPQGLRPARQPSMVAIKD